MASLESVKRITRSKARSKGTDKANTSSNNENVANGDIDAAESQSRSIECLVETATAMRRTRKRTMDKSKNPSNNTGTVKSVAKQTTEKQTQGPRKGAQAVNELVQMSESSLPPTKKRKSKAMNHREREELLASLNSIDFSVFQSEVCAKFDEQFFPEKLKEFTGILRDTEQPLKDIIMSHRLCFVGLYKECKKGPDPFLQFQFQWQKYCSAFLLGSQYAMSEIGLNDSAGYQIGESRAIWLRFCEENEVPVPASNPVMMTISSALYHCLLDHVNCFQCNSFSTTSSTTQEADGDDVYFRFGGAAISDMLHLHYKHIKNCKDSQRDILSQEISILHCMNSKDKVNIPSYLKYRDQGYMYSPDPILIPFLRELDTAVKEIVNLDGLHQEGDNLIKVAHERIHGQPKFFDAFTETLSSRSPNLTTVYSEDALRSVFNTFTRKICNTRIQEFLSATKQQLATKKGLASTVDVNLRAKLLAHHIQLETKIGSNN